LRGGRKDINKEKMSRKFTKRNKQGIKTRSTLLTGIEKMKMYHRQAKTNVRLTRTNSVEKTLDNMLKWLSAVEKCPPRHYGKVWNDEKQQIVEQCRRMYLDAQHYATTQSDALMGDHRGEKKRDGQDGDGRFMPLSRLRWNMATAKWDFTNQVTTGKNPYWTAQKTSPVRTLKGAERDQAYLEYCDKKNAKIRQTWDAMRKVVQPYQPAEARTGPVGGPTVFNYKDIPNQPQHGRVKSGN